MSSESVSVNDESNTRGPNQSCIVVQKPPPSNNATIDEAPAASKILYPTTSRKRLNSTTRMEVGVASVNSNALSCSPPKINAVPVAAATVVNNARNRLARSEESRIGKQGRQQW